MITITPNAKGRCCNCDRSAKYVLICLSICEVCYEHLVVAVKDKIKSDKASAKAAIESCTTHD